MSKWQSLLTSRKFWASVVGLAVALGLLRTSDVQQTELVEALLVVFTAIAYIVSTALEDGLSARAAGQAKPENKV